MPHTAPCIFCERDASASRSKEHIVPESMGNVLHVLAAGIVCDGCNNYFARKIEGPLISGPYFSYQRSVQLISNKRGRVPKFQGFVLAGLNSSRVTIDPSSNEVSGVTQKDHQTLVSVLKAGKAKRLLLNIPESPDPALMSRFLGKVAIEALAERVLEVPRWRSELLWNEAVRPLRTHVRQGGVKAWEFSKRPIYAPDVVFAEGEERFEILHEYDFVYTDKGQIFFILALFGEEFAIDVGNPSIASYVTWLQEHNGRSPLYPVHNGSEVRP